MTDFILEQRIQQLKNHFNTENCLNITITFRPHWHKTRQLSAWKDIQKIIQGMVRYNFHQNFKYVFTIEKHRNTNYHYHGIILLESPCNSVAEYFYNEFNSTFGKSTVYWNDPEGRESEYPSYLEYIFKDKNPPVLQFY